MSIRVMTSVWDGYPDGGTELLALLALADWSDDEGRCWPSISSIAKKTRLSDSQARRTVHRLIESGFLTVIDNATGGATSRRYQIVLDRLTPSVDATPSAGARGSVRASPPLALVTGDPCHSYDSRTVIDTSRPVNEGEQARPASPKKRSKNEEQTLAQFLDGLKAKDEMAIPDDDPIFSYAAKVGIDHQMIAVAWDQLKVRYLTTDKRYKDWRQTFRNAVQRNWFDLWFLKDGEPAKWTTAGEQARRAAA